jgi:hypothetical protein
VKNAAALSAPLSRDPEGLSGRTPRVAAVIAAALPAAPSHGHERLSDWLSVAIPATILAMVGSLIVLGAGMTELMLALAIPAGLLILAFTDTERALMLYFVYCAVEGNLKTMTQYAFLIHVGRDLVLGAVIGGALVRYVIHRDRARSWPRETLLVLLFVAACAVQVANPNSLGLAPSVAALRMHLGALPLFFLTYACCTSVNQVRRFVVVSACLGVFLAAVALLQQHMGPDWTGRVFPGTSDFVHSPTFFITGAGDFWRPPSTTSDGGGASTWIQIGVPACLALLWLVRKRKVIILLVPAFMGIMFAGLVVSSVRAMAIIAGLEAIVALVLLVRFRDVPGLVPIVLLSLGVATVAWQLFDVQSTDVIQSRFSLVQNPVAAFQQHRAYSLWSVPRDIEQVPFGAGLGRTGPAAAEFSDLIEAQPLPGMDSGFMNSENYFAGILSETGVLGGLIITVLSAVFLVRGFATARRLRDPGMRACAVALFTILLGIVVSFFDGPSLYTPPLSIYFWACAGFLSKLPSLEPAANPEQPRLAHAGLPALVFAP